MKGEMSEMSEEFKPVEPQHLEDNVFRLVGNDWMLITAGQLDRYNTMTASWGGLGILWGKKVAFCVVRPTRHTYEFIESSDHFSLSFFTEEYRDVLDICGSTSGKDVDKAAEAGITAVEETPGVVYFNEARLVLECRKLYFQDFDPQNFLDDSIQSMYELKDYHRMYIGEITQARIKE